MKNVQNFFTCKDIAIRLGVCMDTVRKYIRNGQIKAQKFGCKYIVSENEFMKLFNSLCSKEE